ncbi:unnamed protein product [Zymoseptoria tritici ST99CH_1E4]|uniref:Glutamyl-tRNA(Gln) amidotransferase subunit A, mitochondrial n=1 Tax=Zymoseptoria tritici ST99CH_1E4 TaxID=1276532 RepID=A0A2H1G5Q8_ZYMTR|nr:unnamed protein product [Zymoseptoria tritici ST99CH_1E4]
MQRTHCLLQGGSRLCRRQFSTNVILHSTLVSRDQQQQTPPPEGPLAGKHIGVKANIVAGTPHAASKTLSNFKTPYTATVVDLLTGAGATVQHGQNMDEFGMGSHSQFSNHGPVKSSFSRAGTSLSPGGSSGGSAISVATGECWAAIGTDTGGSVRLPAAYTGVVGFKPSYGRISRWGVIQYANSLDTVGVMARSVADVRRVFGVVDRWDWRDGTSLKDGLRERMSSSGKGKSLRIGVPAEYNVAEVSPVVREVYTRTLQALQAAGHILVPVSLPTTREALSAYYVLAPAEASSNLAKYDGIRYGHRTSTSDASPNADPPLPLYAQTRGEGFGPEVKRRILLGAYTLSSEAMDNYFIQAQKVRRLVQQDFDRVFYKENPLLSAEAKCDDEEAVDLLLTPTAPTLPPTIVELEEQSSLESYMNDVFTVPASLAGLPAISIPIALTAEQRDGMEETDVRSVGMQLIGQFGDDNAVLSAAELLEKLSL